jgi:hypothetical protein
MRERATALAVAVGLVIVGVACGGGAEKAVVNQYFHALASNDTTTLTSFAAVAFDKQVDDFKIVSVSEETRRPATLPDLVARQRELEAELAENKKAAQAWGNDLEIYPKLDRVRELEKDDKKIPKSLQPIAEKWDEYNQKDRELKTKVAEAKDAVATERRHTQLSVGQVEGVENLAGESVTKTVDLELTIDGQVQPYVMTLKKYELEQEGARRMVSRWVVLDLEPKG